MGTLCQVVRGHVVVEGSKERITDLVVRVGGRGRTRFQLLGETRTSANGAFSFDLARLPPLPKGMSRYEILVFQREEQLTSHGDTSWRRGTDPGPLTICVEVEQHCAIIYDEATPGFADNYTVFGRVRHADGTPIDSVNVSVQVKSVSLAGENDVGSPLSTNAEGWYGLAATLPANLVVRVYETIGEVTRLIGSSRVAFNVQEQIRLDVKVCDDKYRRSTEYSRLMDAVVPLLDGEELFELDLRAIAALSGATGWDVDRILLLSVASRIKKTSPVTLDREPVYGLLRRGFPTSLESFLARPRSTVGPALVRAAALNIIASTWAEPASVSALEVILAGYLKDRLHTLHEGSFVGRPDTLGAILETSGNLSHAQIQTFVESWVGWEGTEAAFWTNASSLSGFDGDDVAEAKRLVTLGTLGLSFAPIVSSILGELGSDPASGVAAFSPGQWASITNATNLTSLPSGLPGETTPDKRDNLAAMLAEHAERMFPASTARAALLPGLSAVPLLEDAEAFLTTNSSFDLARSRVDDGAFSGSGPERTATKITQRLYRIAPESGRAAAILALGEAGYTSAHAVVHRGRARFVESLDGVLDSVIAEEIHRKASALHAITTQFLAAAHPYNSQAAYRFLPNEEVDTEGIPDWETLFGNTDTCACVHCRSVLSPAAYMVDLLQWLQARPVEDAEGTLYDALIARRPDLVHIELSCENTERALPYIDLVLEALESAVQHDGAIDDDAAHQTVATTPDMLAAPQHRADAAYTTLGAAVNMPTLPYRRDIDEMRTFLRHLGVPRSELLRAWLGTITTAQLAVEELGTFPAQLTAITAATGSETTYWPVDDLASLEAVSTLRKVSRLSWPEILDVFHTRYVNPDRDLSFEATDWCDLDTVTVVRLGDPDTAPVEADWTRFRQFLRLLRLTGLSALDLDRVLTSLGVDDLTASGGSVPSWFEELGALHRASSLTGISIVDLVQIRAASLDTWTDRTSREEPEPSLYDQVFLAPSLFVDGDPERVYFVLNLDRDELFDLDENPSTFEALADHAPAIAAALGLEREELDVLLGVVGLGTDMTLASLSRLYAWSLVCRATKLDPTDVVPLCVLLELDPFADSADLVRLIDRWTVMREAGWSVDELRYVQLHERGEVVAPTDKDVQTALGKLRDAVRATFDALGDAVTEATARDMVVRTLADQLGLPRDALQGLRLLTWSNLPALDEGAAFVFAEEVHVTAPSEQSFEIVAGTRFILEAGTSVLRNGGTAAPLAEDTVGRLETTSTGTTTDLIAAQGTSWERATDGDATLPVDTVVQFTSLEFLSSTTFIAENGDTLEIEVDTDIALESRGSSALASPVTGAITWTSAVTSSDLVQRFLRDDFVGELNETQAQPYDDIIPDSAYAEDIAVYHALAKVALLLKRLDLDDEERSFWYAEDGTWEIAPVTWLDGAAALTTPFIGLERLIRLFALRRRISGSDPSFVEVLEAATAETDPDVALAQAISARTDWSSADLAVLTAQVLALLPSLGAVESVLERMEIVRRVGASADSVSGWAVPAGSVTSTLSAEVVSAARARAGTTDAWTSVARPQRDRLRKSQRDALVDYLLGKKFAEDGSTVRDAEDLYQHYLIDVSMNPELLTSRIVQANATIQLFGHRLMLGLELQEGGSPLFEPDAEDREQWEWMKTYRVWEAARKVFLYPENWIEPELRDDKTPFFRALESELSQGDITEDRVEQALLDYLDRLQEVSNLQVLALYWQTETIEKADDIDILHVFARTRSDPPTYWYRRFEDGSRWTPWEKVECGVEGGHLLPVAYERRLMLIWARFSEASGDTENSPTWWEIRLSWSEYRDGKWSTPLQSKEGWVDTVWGESDTHGTSAYLLTASTTSEGVHVQVVYRQDRVNGEEGTSYPVCMFTLNPCTRDMGVGEADQNQDARVAAPATFWWNPGFNTEDDLDDSQDWSTELHLYQADCDDELQPLEGSTYSAVPVLYSAQDMTLVVPDQIGDFVSQTPFFVQTPKRCWFVRRTNPIQDMAESLRSIAALRKGTWVAPTGTIGPTDDDTAAELVSYLPGSRYSTTSAAAALASADATLTSFADGSRFGLVGGDYLFTTFYHPHVCAFLAAVRRDGVFALLDPDADGPEPELRRQQLVGDFNFDTELNPDDNNVDHDYPVEDIDFSSVGAYTEYNWELFFHLPLYVACRLSENGREDDAMAYFHAIFDPRVPQSDIEGLDLPEAARWWKVAPFMQPVSSPVTDWIAFTGEDGDDEAAAAFQEQVDAWRDEPFNPHRIARLRPGTYQKVVVMRYIENLLSWGDRLFARDSLESINEATQLYVYAKQILGDRPEELPPHEEVEAKTFAELLAEGTFDAFGNVILENAFTPEVSSGLSRFGGLVVAGGVGLSTYFCVPQNAKLISYWDTVADRLFKIRNGMNLEGVVRSLPLFEPPIDPAMLVRAAAAGLDIGQVVSQGAAALPAYRFQVLHGRAVNLASSVRTLGGALLSALEKRDAEALALLRSEQEITLLGAVRAVREQQIDEAQASLDAARASKNLVKVRKQYYDKLLARGWLVDEKKAVEESEKATKHQITADTLAAAASLLGIIPTIYASPTCPAAKTGGEIALSVAMAASQSFGARASYLRSHAANLNTKAGYKRRADEWKHQVKLADKEMAQIDKQITAAEIRLAIAKKELKNHDTQVRHAEQVRDWMTSKFTNQELYHWMVTQLATLHFQTWQLALATARKAERCYQHELGLPEASFVQAVHWDSLKKGLLAGERLSHDLERLDAAYLTQDTREFELTKHVSLARLDPFALASFVETGSCSFDLPEVIFDLDCPGHYFRRISNVSVSLSCLSGPQAGVHFSLSLGGSALRRKAQTGEDGEVLTTETSGGTTTIVTSTGREDAGLFQLNPNDPRYLPFERRGAVNSAWTLALCNPDWPGVDLSTLSDVVLHLRYTARDGGASFASSVRSGLQAALNALELASPQDLGLTQVISAKRDEGDAFGVLLTPETTEEEATYSITIRKRDLPTPIVQSGKTVSIKGLYVALLGVSTSDWDSETLELDWTLGAAAQTVTLSRSGSGPVLGFYLLSGGSAQAPQTLSDELALTLTLPAAPTSPPDLVTIDGTDPARINGDKLDDFLVILVYELS